MSEVGAPAATLHQRIRADIEARILSGDWPPGHRIPYEHELMVRYGCSRMTVNKAISDLARAGLIERRRKAGSFVAQPHFESAVLRIPDLKTEVAARGEAYGYELLSRSVGKVGRRGDAAAGLAPGEPILSITCRHLANGQPLVFEARTISLKTVPEAAEADLSCVPPGSWLLEHVPWTEAEHRISALNADRELAAALDIERAAACLCLERRTWRSGAPVTFVRQIFRGDRYHLSAHFSP